MVKEMPSDISVKRANYHYHIYHKIIILSSYDNTKFMLLLHILLKSLY